MASATAPTYSITPSSPTVIEGNTATFVLTTTNVPAGTLVNYFVSGVDSPDAVANFAGASLVMSGTGVAIISIPTLIHATNQGSKTLVVTTNGISASETLIDNAPITSSLKSGSIITFSSLISSLSANSFSITDSFYSIASNLDVLALNIGKISSITEVGSILPMTISVNQLVNDVPLFSLINGRYSLNIANVTIANLNSVANSPLQKNSSFITDTASNIANNLNLLTVNYYKAAISSITITDNQPLILTSAQAAGNSDVLSMIKSSGGTVTVLLPISLSPNAIYTAGANQVISGSSGLNTVIFNEPFSNFSITNSNGSIVLKDNVGSLGVETLASIQRVKFSDGSNVAFDFQSGQNGFNAAMIIGTSFGASNVSTYFPSAITLIDQGQTNSQISALIEQFGLIENQLGIGQANTPGSNKIWVDFVYKNVVGISPDPLSEALCINNLNNGMTRSQLLTIAVNFADEGNGNLATQVNLTGLQQQGLVYHPSF